MPMVNISKATIDQLIIISEIEKELFTPAFSYEQLEYELNTNPFSKFYVVKQEDKIIGYGILWCTFETAQIIKIGIMKKYQHLGFGTELLKEMIMDAKKEKCENIALEVRASNDKAISFYKKQGFKKISVRPNYYQQPSEDADIMWRSLL